MKNTRLVLVVLAVSATVLAIRFRVPDSSSSTSAATAPAKISILYMSSDAQGRVREACKQAVSADNGLKLHRRGRFGPQRDRILLYSWGDMFVHERTDVSEYQVRSFVDTVIDDTGNVHRTPYICTVRNDFVVLSLGFGEVWFPRKNPFAAKPKTHGGN